MKKLVKILNILNQLKKGRQNAEEIQKALNLDDKLFRIRNVYLKPLVTAGIVKSIAGRNNHGYELHVDSVTMQDVLAAFGVSLQGADNRQVWEAIEAFLECEVV